MTQQARDQVGRFGIWRSERQVTPELAATVEELGFGALWLGSANGDLAAAEEFLAATTTLTVATGIVNMWQYEPHQVAASFRRVEERFPGRFLLGVGAGHPEVTQQYAKPYDTLARYVGTLLDDGVPAGRLVLAALGPKVLRLAGERTAGAHPYLVTPGYTAQARKILGPGPLLAPEQKVVIGTDPVQARAIGRPRVEKPYLGLANYTANLRRLGWTDADLSGGGSDALIDALVAHGSAAQVVAHLTEHLDAGADHVSIQLLTPPGAGPADGYRELAGTIQARSAWAQARATGAR
ncbi:MAG: TIGR03620 family F420-dependent LLM class oxidoreductase [Streptosporangiaceae bacterium]|jgi:probable F420-dependent oxidoreductase